MSSEKANQLLNKFGGNVTESMVGSTDLPVANVAGEPVDSKRRRRDQVDILVERIMPNPEGQVRKHTFGDEADKQELHELAESLKKHGQQQNLVVYYNDQLHKYIIISGERRWRAATIAGLKYLHCKVLENKPTEAEILELQLIENIQRTDLNAIETSAAYQALIDKHGWTAGRLAEEVKVGISKISKLLALQKLAPSLQQQVISGALSQSMAYDLSRLDNHQDQIDTALAVKEKKLNSRQVNKELQKKKGRRAHKTSKSGTRIELDLPTGTLITISSSEELTPQSICRDLKQAIDAAEEAQQRKMDVNAVALFAKESKESKGKTTGKSKPSDTPKP